MRKKLIAVTVTVLAALPSYGGIRSNVTRVNGLQIDGVSYGGSWDVSSPTLRNRFFCYLAYDVSGESRKVLYSFQKGPQTTWAFVEMQPFTSEQRGKGSKRGLDLEQRGYTLKLRATAGPFKGWYLGRVDGSLVLVKNPKDAATLRLQETRADIEHK
ncbi:MAG TPA: hypothetical protein VH643_41725 [Gemmataceae bacterium]|jgi:hypothetical protein